ncbi:MAG: hypothetical protein J5965_19090 [Aeriscardovia sp.]|nr:hypothetical protein [Aeriscardovia sp.]
MSTMDTTKYASYGNGHYQVQRGEKTWDTTRSELLGVMPVCGSDSVLYKDPENGYFVISFSKVRDLPGFTPLNNSEGKLWEKGIENYWAGKRA